MDKFLENLNNRTQGKSSPSPGKRASSFPNRRGASPRNWTPRKIDLSIKNDDCISDDLLGSTSSSDSVDNSTNFNGNSYNNEPCAKPTKVRKIDQDYESITPDNSNNNSNTSFIPPDETTTKIQDEENDDIVSTDHSNSSRERSASSSGYSSYSSSSSSSSSASSSSSFSSSLLQPFSFLSNTRRLGQISSNNGNGNAVPTSTTESSWLQAINTKISSVKKTVPGVPTASASAVTSDSPFHNLLASAAAATTSTSPTPHLRVTNITQS